MGDQTHSKSEQTNSVKRSPSRLQDEAAASEELTTMQATAQALKVPAGIGQPSKLKPAQVLALQQTVGNRVVSGMLSRSPASRKARPISYPFQINNLIRDRSPAYLQMARVASPAYFRQELQSFRQDHPDAELAGYQARLSEPSSQVTISRPPLQQIRRMAREPERAVENLRELNGYLGRADQVIGVGIGAADTLGGRRAAEQLRSARDALGRIREPISRLAAVLEMAENLNEVVSAIQELEGMDIRHDRRAAAAAFDRLFTNIGEVGESVPGLPPYVVPYFTLLSNVGSFFSDMVDLMDPTTRPGAGSSELRDLESGRVDYYGGDPGERGFSPR